MNRIKKYGSGLLITMVMLFTVSSCDLTELDINKDPNNPAQASLNLLLTNVELNASATFAGGLNNSTMGFVGLTTSTDDYNMTNSSWNGTWNYLYNNPLKDLDGMIKATAQQRADGAPNGGYEGVAKVLKAYYFSMMVDLWGDVPYTEAFAGDAETQILAPAFEDDAAIYPKLITLLDEAIVHLAEPGAVAVSGDVIYSGNKTKWIEAAKSLKLRLLIQMSGSQDPAIIAQIQATMDAGGFITSAANDFQFTFGKLQNPDDRHPMYSAAYAGGTAGYTYFGHQFMYEMLRDSDPRRRFYFKRQTSTILDPSDPTDKQTIPCSQRTDCVYGYFPFSDLVAQGVYGVPASNLSAGQAGFLAGFFGRDRADPSGIPNDNPIRTTVGVYPAGGLYDDGPEAGGAGGGIKGKESGNGIFPMVTTWMVKLYQLEAILKLGVTSTLDPATLFRDAMREQIAKVSNLGVSLDPQSVAVTTAARDAYVNPRVTAFSALGSNNAKFDAVLKQSWFMNFGNGFELYNAFRRHGPTAFNLQAPLQLPRQFALRLPYAQDEINLNVNTPSVTYDSPSSAVFWDVLKFQF
jgi:hypothetical protein